MPATTRPSAEEQRAVLEAIEELEADRARAYARAMTLRAEAARLWEHDRPGFVEMELAGTALIGQIRATRELDDARRLTSLFPQLHALLSDGVVFVPTAEAVLTATRRCTDEVQQGVDARLAGRLIGMNVTDVRRLVRVTILTVEADLDPQLTTDRLDAAQKDARVWITPGTDGTTSIGAVLDAVAGRRWALDFAQLVKAQQTLDARAGLDRPLHAVQAEVFAHLPTLVLELVRAARQGRLTDLAELDPDTAAELEQLVRDTTDLPLPEQPGDNTDDTQDTAEDTADAEVGAEADADAGVDTVTGEIRVEDDPFDLAAAIAADPDRDLLADLVWTPGTEPTEPDPPEGPLPRDPAAQDAAPWTTAAPDPRQDLLTQVLLLRCLQMPLPNPTVVNLHLPMATALDLTHAPGLLEGHGPLDAVRIRQLLPTAQLREVYADETTGVPLGAQPKPGRVRPEQATLPDLATRLRPVTLTDHVEPQHDPSTALRAFVQLRDQHCTGPGCTMPANRCDLDHEDAHPHGPTAEWNLADKSRRCHGAKHHGWTAQRHPDGTTTWTSPTGRTYRTTSPWQPPPRPTRPPTPETE